MLQRSLLLLAATTAFQQLNRPPRTVKTRLKATQPDGWTDLSGGGGACCLRTLRAGAPGGARPTEGSLCTVKWTVWLAEKRGAWWARGERVGVFQPNATLEFTFFAASPFSRGSRGRLF